MEINITELIKEYAGTFAIISMVLIPLVIETIFTYIGQPQNKFWNSLLTFVIAVVVVLIVWPVSLWLDVGFLSEVTQFWQALLWGVGAGIVANWAWAIDILKLVIQFIITWDFNKFKLSRTKP